MLNFIRKFLLACVFVCTASLFIKAGCSKTKGDLEDSPILPTSDQYITWSVGNIQGSLLSPSDSVFFSVTDGWTSISGMTPYSTANPLELSAVFFGTTEGVFNAKYLSIYKNGTRQFASDIFPLKVNISTYGAVGQYVVGSFSGTVKDSVQIAQGSQASQAIKGNFRVKRVR
jgi:hypothetical protein